jgi:hypothetical protein
VLGIFWVAGDLFGPTDASCYLQHGQEENLKLSYSNIKKELLMTLNEMSDFVLFNVAFAVRN